MFEIFCVTNRKLCEGEFLGRVRRIAACRPAGLILREKDMHEKEYKMLAAHVLEICRAYHTSCILHTFVEVAAELGAGSIHLPLPVLRRLDEGQKRNFSRMGASCHSLEEVREAQALGCAYAMVGHIFETDCKNGLPGRGISFLEEAVRAVQIPVYAIGGICSENILQVRGTGAAGACVMSGVMRCEDVSRYLGSFV